MELASNRAPSNEGIGFDAIYQGVSQKVTYTGTQGQSAALQKRTSVVILYATSNCFVQIGLTTDNAAAGPTAATDGTSMWLPLGVQMKVAVPNNGLGQIAVIEATANGTLYITEGL